MRRQKGSGDVGRGKDVKERKEKNGLDAKTMKVRRSRLIKVQRIPEAGRSVGGRGDAEVWSTIWMFRRLSRSAERFFQSAGLGRPRGRRGDPQAKVQGEREPMAGSGAWQDAGAGHKL